MYACVFVCVCVCVCVCVVCVCTYCVCVCTHTHTHIHTHTQTHTHTYQWLGQQSEHRGSFHSKRTLFILREHFLLHHVCVSGSFHSKRTLSILREQILYATERTPSHTPRVCVVHIRIHMSHICDRSRYIHTRILQQRNGDICRDGHNQPTHAHAHTLFFFFFLKKDNVDQESVLPQSNEHEKSEKGSCGQGLPPAPCFSKKKKNNLREGWMGFGSLF